MDILGYAELFESITFVFARRESNKIAHRLAKMEGECNMFEVRENSLPSNLFIL